MSEVARACDTAVETGITAFDYGLLGIGGIPSGQFIQIYGKEGTGKTTLMLHIIAGMQRNGRIPLVLDQKCAVASDVARAKRIGVDPENVVLLPISTTEDALEKTRKLIHDLYAKGVKQAFFWDDLGLAPVESNMDLKKRKEAVAEKARSIWQFCQTLNGVCFKCDVPMVIVNQLIAVIGKSFGFGGPKMITSGGGGARFASRININLAQGEKIKDGSSVVGHKIYARTDKNAFFAPQMKAELYLSYRNGILSRESTLLNAGRLISKERGGNGYKCAEAGVTEYKSFDAWSKGELWALEGLLWPWISDPQGYDWSKLLSHGEVTEEEAEDDAIIEEFF